MAGRLGRLAAAAAGFVFLADLLLRGVRPPRPVAALLDEPAHLATAGLLLAALCPRPGPRLLLGAGLGAVLLDADHLPRALGSDLLTGGAERPYPHSLPAAGGLLLVAAAARGPGRRLALGAAFGLATHLVRDMATGGVPLCWPLTTRTVGIPYGAYAAALLLGLGAILRRGA